MRARCCPLNNRPLILASNSPRRRQLLQQIGVPFSIQAMDIDESRHDSEAALDYVARMANEKAHAALAQVGADPAAIVLAADTIVVVDDTVLGKPDNSREAQAMLAMLSDRQHRVLTAVAVVDGSYSRQAVSESSVGFRAISAAEAESYWHTGEPRGKAGGYAIQGLGAVFVNSLNGSYSGVMGLPLYETAGLLQEFGVPVWETSNE